MMKVMITGGAGFIGTHLVPRLLKEGCEIVVFDNLSPQIHGSEAKFKFGHGATCIRGDVRDRAALWDALDGCECIVHLAAETGTGQSMYEVGRYESTNIGGTANLIDYVINDARSRIQHIVVASSRAIYGEGLYFCAEHEVVAPGARAAEDMLEGQFQPRCPKCQEFVNHIPTTESAPLSSSSFYGLTKRVQEEMILMFAREGKFRGVALRYQNVFGPGQSLNNPYTGILAIFSNLARAGKPIQVFEDGQESRDFVYIEDVVEATALAVVSSKVRSGAYNVGSGVGTSVQAVAANISSFFGGVSPVTVSGAFRTGDIRHNVAELSLATSELGFIPKWSFERGLGQFLAWVASSEPGDIDRINRSMDELKQRGLFRG